MLIDFGATHYFTFKRFAKKLGRQPEKQVESFIVTTPTVETIETCEFHKDCRINISDQTFSADMIQLVIVYFDTILEMD